MVIYTATTTTIISTNTTCHPRHRQKYHQYTLSRSPRYQDTIAIVTATVINMFVTIITNPVTTHAYHHCPLSSECGRLLILDLRYAKIEPYKTFTICGSPHYMSPEQVNGSGHSTEVIQCLSIYVYMYIYLTL